MGKKKETTRFKPLPVQDTEFKVVLKAAEVKAINYASTLLDLDPAYLMGASTMVGMAKISTELGPKTEMGALYVEKCMQKMSKTEGLTAEKIQAIKYRAIIEIYASSLMDQVSGVVK